MSIRLSGQFIQVKKVLAPKSIITLKNTPAKILQKNEVPTYLLALSVFRSPTALAIKMLAPTEIPVKKLANKFISAVVAPTAPTE